jgi:hypothetical protein
VGFSALFGALGVSLGPWLRMGQLGHARGRCAAVVPGPPGSLKPGDRADQGRSRCSPQPQPGALVATGNRAPSNGGTILDTDLLTPILVAVLLWLSRAERTRLKG